MKNMKKVFSLVLALVMMMALTVTAGAKSTATTPATITIKNASKGETYTAYKLFDARVNGTGGITYTGDIPTALEDFFTVATNGQIAPVDGLNVASKNFQTALKAWLKDKSAKVTYAGTGEGGPLDIKVPYGYYIVTSTIEDANGAVIMVDSTNPNAEIYDKNSAGTPSFPEDGKTADGVTFDKGETVTYTVKFNTVNWIGSDSTAKQVTEYTIKDTATSGYLSNVTVTGITIDGNPYTVKNADNEDVVPQFGEDGTITFSWVDTDNNSLYANGAQIVITYTATVTGDGAGKNTVDASYKTGNDNHDDVPEKEVTVYNSKIVVDKYTMVGEGTEAVDTKLPGAKFVLAREVALGTVEDEGTGVSMAATTGYEYYKISEGVVSWVLSRDDATEVTTDTVGAATFEGLKDGQYFLIETEAPAGYNLKAEPTLVEVKAGDTEHAISYTESVLNQTGTELPSTGGIGTTIFTVTGGLLMIGAAILFLTKKRSEV